MKKYTIELDNDLGRGELVLKNKVIVCILPNGEEESTEVRSDEEHFENHVECMYGSSVWDLQTE